MFSTTHHTSKWLLHLDNSTCLHFTMWVFVLFPCYYFSGDTKADILEGVSPMDYWPVSIWQMLFHFMTCLPWKELCIVWFMLQLGKKMLSKLMWLSTIVNIAQKETTPLKVDRLTLKRYVMWYIALHILLDNLFLHILTPHLPWQTQY